MAKKVSFLLNELETNIQEEKLLTEKEVLNHIIILPELKSYIPALSEEEFKLLEINILEEGCRDAIILWENNQQFIIIDGHNRYSICQKHSLKFKYQIKNFIDIEDVKLWMLNNQLGKRNLTETQKSYLRGKQYQLEKMKKGRPVKKEEKNSPKPQKTVDRLAELHKVSDRTIKNDEKYALIIDALSTHHPDLKWKILNQTIDLPKTSFLILEEVNEKTLQLIGNDLANGLDFKTILKKYFNTENTSARIAQPQPETVLTVKNIKKDIDWIEMNKIHDLLADAIKSKNEILLKEIARLLKNIL